MLSQQIIHIVIDQICDTQKKHPDLELRLLESEKLVVQGIVSFSKEFESNLVKDAYEVEIYIPCNYPERPPFAKEVGNVIPDSFHKFSQSGNLCLGAPIEVKRVFAQNKTLLGFIDDQLITYLFSYSCYRDYGKLPNGELSHGPFGFLEYYSDFFDTDPISAMKLLKLLAINYFPSNLRCPCNSGNTVRKCHGAKLKELQPLYKPKDFARELDAIITELRDADIWIPENDLKLLLL